MFQDSDNIWWDSFATEFFEDEAQLTLQFCLEDGPKRYSMYNSVLNHDKTKENDGHAYGK